MGCDLQASNADGWFPRTEVVAIAQVAYHTSASASLQMVVESVRSFLLFVIRKSV